MGSTPDSVEIVRDGATSSDGFWNVPQRASVWGSIAIGAVAVAGWVAAFVGGLAVAYAASLIR
ncbi:hypothetical protein FJZ36_14350 [Candidatus Poribacteria bacterium]|nr:hypothetical protein [Candidatus Poribacteria bacterium]